MNYVFLAIASAINLFFSYQADKRFRKLKLGGKASIKLRSDLMSTVIQLTGKEQTRFTPGTVTQIMEGQVATAVTKGFVQVFELYDATALCFVIVLYSMFLILVIAPPGVPSYLRIGFVCMPFLIMSLNILILSLSVRVQKNLTENKFKEADTVTQDMIESTNLRQLITTYRKGNDVTEEYKAKHKDWNKANPNPNPNPNPR